MEWFLRECPFCGSEDVDLACLDKHTLDIEAIAWVICNHCGAAGSSFVENNLEDATRKAAEAWNSVIRKDSE